MTHTLDKNALESCLALWVILTTVLTRGVWNIFGGRPHIEFLSPMTRGLGRILKPITQTTSKF